MSLQTPSEIDQYLAPLEERSGTFYGALVVTAALTIVGLAIWLLEVTGGHMANLGNWGTAAGVPWGLDIGAFGWWTGMAVGALLLSALIRVLRIDGYLGFARIGEFLAPLAFLASFLHILYDLGRPERVLNSVLFVQVESPLFWDIVLIGGLVVLSVLYLLANVREDVGRLVADEKLPDSGLHSLLAGSPATPRKNTSAWWIGAIILVFVPVVGGGLVPWAWSQLGVSMNWFGAVQGPTFLLMSLTAGMAAVLLIAGLLRGIYGWTMVFTNRRLEVMGGATAGAGFFYLVATTFSVQSGAFAPTMATREVGSLIATGPLGGLFLFAIVAIALPAIVLGVQLATDYFNSALMIAMSVALLIGIVVMQTVVIAGGLSHPEMMYPASEYVPSIAEWVRLLGTISLVALGYLVLTKLLPIVPVRALESGARE